MAQWLSWLERRPVTAEVTSSSLVWVVFYADMAQLAEQLICNQQVFGSSPNIGSRSNAEKGFYIFRASLLAKKNRKIFFHTAEQLTEQSLIAKVVHCVASALT